MEVGAILIPIPYMRNRQLNTPTIIIQIVRCFIASTEAESTTIEEILLRGLLESFQA